MGNIRARSESIGVECELKHAQSFLNDDRNSQLLGQSQQPVLRTLVQEHDHPRRLGEMCRCVNQQLAQCNPKRLRPRQVPRQLHLTDQSLSVDAQPSFLSPTPRTGIPSLARPQPTSTCRNTPPPAELNDRPPIHPPPLSPSPSSVNGQQRHQKLQ